MMHGFLTVENPYDLFSEIFVFTGTCEWMLAMRYEEVFANVGGVLYVKQPILTKSTRSQVVTSRGESGS
jgi:hypothetical protein